MRYVEGKKSDSEGNVLCNSIQVQHSGKSKRSENSSVVAGVLRLGYSLARKGQQEGFGE